MSISAAQPGMTLRAPPSATGVRRLWPALARPTGRHQPLKGADVAAEWVLGAMLRRRLRRLEWRRAGAIAQEGRRLADGASASLDEAVAHAREQAARDRDAPGAIDAAFGVAYAAIAREIGLRLHDEQVLGGLAMARGCCAELATGEGKTVTAILPAVLDAWSGRGVHILTVNDYLARRDAELNAPAYRRLGLSVGVIQEGSTPDERRAAYSASITHASDKQAIFDHLRDRLISPVTPTLTGLLLDGILGGADGAAGREATSQAYLARWGELIVQRGLHAAIVDEADSVLIDDAVTPAVISGSELEDDSFDARVFVRAADIARELVRDADFSVEARARRVALTPAGRERLGALGADLPPPWNGPRRREELIVQALSARELYRVGEDYIIREGKIEIVDRSTGRVLPGRQWQLGMHQAVEAKEGVEVTRERRTTARCSYQDFFRRYRRLSGMTGTAREVSAELWRWYRLPVVSVPTHRPVARRRLPDRVLADEPAKLEEIARRVRELHAAQRPVLVGTRSITSSEKLGEVLAGMGIACDVLNAEREREEAAIVSRAGRAGAVTVATNMAGRGTDIRLDEAARAAGGLAVIATERHDEPRVDRQLFGRSGRQGDPGTAEVFVAMSDALVRQHGLAPLAWLARLPGLVGGWAARALWRGAQWSASRKWRIIREETARSDAWHDVALLQQTR